MIVPVCLWDKKYKEIYNKKNPAHFNVYVEIAQSRPTKRFQYPLFLLESLRIVIKKQILLLQS